MQLHLSLDTVRVAIFTALYAVILAGDDFARGYSAILLYDHLNSFRFRYALS